MSRRRDATEPVERRCAYCGGKTRVTKDDARAATALSRTVHAPIRVQWPPICHETETTYARTRAIALEATS